MISPNSPFKMEKMLFNRLKLSLARSRRHCSVNTEECYMV